jgi:anthranilate phosphoribosyltransferase
MRNAAGPRRALGVATIFNFLGPLTNPAGATRQSLGVSDAHVIDQMVETLHRLGSKHVIAFHGSDGLDELTLSGPSQIVELRDRSTRRYELDPLHLGIARAPVEALAGGSAQENAATIRSVLAGEEGPRRDVVVLNAGAGLVAADRAADLSEGIRAAAESIDSGTATAALDALVEASNSL